MPSSYTLTWSSADKGAIGAEMQALKSLEPELSRVMAFIAQVAKDGHTATTQNFHCAVNGRNLHSACPFGNIGIYYAYASLPATEIYILGLSVHYLAHYPNVVPRIANVP